MSDSIVDFEREKGIKNYKGRFMVISGSTVMNSSITSFAEGVRELRRMHWISPAPVLVKVICNAEEI